MYDYQCTAVEVIRLCFVVSVIDQEEWSVCDFIRHQIGPEVVCCIETTIQQTRQILSNQKFVSLRSYQ